MIYDHWSFNYLVEIKVCRRSNKNKIASVAPILNENVNVLIFLLTDTKPFDMSSCVKTKNECLKKCNPYYHIYILSLMYPNLSKNPFYF